MTQKQRARSDTDKQQRREHILDTALAMWDTHTFASFTMADVAARSGLAKGTVYLYFQTKEELFLALLDRQLQSWFDDLDVALMEPGDWDVPRAADLLCASLERRAALTRLLPIAASVLEHNIPLETARAYKERLLERSTRSGALLERQLPFLAPGDGFWLLMQIYALVVGLGQMADPAPIVRQVLEEKPLSVLQVDFSPAFRRTITTFLYGLEFQSRR
jgi:AcrR family transcriptional regulator